MSAPVPAVVSTYAQLEERFNQETALISTVLDLMTRRGELATEFADRLLALIPNPASRDPVLTVLYEEFRCDARVHRDLAKDLRHKLLTARATQERKSSEREQMQSALKSGREIVTHALEKQALQERSVVHKVGHAVDHVQARLAPFSKLAARVVKKTGLVLGSDSAKAKAKDAVASAIGEAERALPALRRQCHELDLDSLQDVRQLILDYGSGKKSITLSNDPIVRKMQ
jgi:hypothetical protein